MKNKPFNKKQTFLIKKLENILNQCSEAGIALYGQNDQLQATRKELYNQAMNRKNPFYGKIEMYYYTLSEKCYQDSGADDTIFLDEDIDEYKEEV